MTSSSELLIKSGVEEREGVGDAVKTIALITVLLLSSGVSDISLVKSTTVLSLTYTWSCTWLVLLAVASALTSAVVVVLALQLELNAWFATLALAFFMNGVLQLNRVNCDIVRAHKGMFCTTRGKP